MSQLRLSQAGINELMRSEGKRNKAYQDQSGIWTIAYGHTGKVDGVPIHKGMVISDQKVAELLRQRLPEFEQAVASSIKVPLKQHQFDALVNLAYNIGPSGFKKSNVAKLINEQNFQGAADAMLEINKNKDPNTQRYVFNPGLFNRRVREREMFLGGEKINAPMPENMLPIYDSIDKQPITQPTNIADQLATTFQASKPKQDNSFADYFNQINSTLDPLQQLEPIAPKQSNRVKYQEQLAQAFGIEPQVNNGLGDYVSDLVKSIYDQA